MRGVANFYTIFWILYFPTSIAFNDAAPWMKYADEVLTVIIVAYTLAHVATHYTVRAQRREYVQFLVILALYVLYGLLFGANVQAAVWRDAVQWMRPFSVIYCTWLLNPRFSEWQKRCMLASMLLTMLAFLAYHPETVERRHVEFATLGQMAMCTGMAWYLFTDATRQNAYIATAIVLSGLLAPKFKYLGELVVFLGMMYAVRGRLDFRRLRTPLVMAVMGAVIIYVTWSKFDQYYISGMAEGAERMARPESYKVAFGKILWEYLPFGSGLGSFGCAAAADYYSPLYYKYDMTKIWGLAPSNPMFLADAFYPTLPQLGVVGIWLFCVFWKRRLVALNRIIDMRYYRVAWIAFFCLALEQVADSSFLSGKGMGYCMLIGLCLNANRNMLRRLRDEILL